MSFLSSKQFKSLIAIFLSVALIIISRKSYAQNLESELPEDITQLSLKNLMDLDLVVTSPGKKEQELSHVTSAVFVISNEQIKRSGATHIAEVLRTVPGVNVARIASNRWAVSVRGFNQVFTNKLLVLVDGVSVFSPTTNGVYWETLDIPLETIERIEVIRGPGAALWGSNAVNGVINIITKSALVSTGTEISGGGGTHEQGFGEILHGDQIGDDSAYRAFAKYVVRGENYAVVPNSESDRWKSGSAGLRFDSHLSEIDQLTVSGDYAQQWEHFQPTIPLTTAPFSEDQSFIDSPIWRGAKVLASWKRDLEGQSDLETRFSVVHKDRSKRFVTFDYQAYTGEIQHHFQPFESHDVVYGGSYRFFHNDTTQSYAHLVNPSIRETNLATLFVQDAITLIPDLMEVTLGSKLEHNDLSGLEFMPNARLLVTPNKSVSIWGAVSRAVAPPAIFFEDATIPVEAFPIPDAPILGVAEVIGNRDLESENLLAYEIGSRMQLSPAIFADLATFYNTHDDIFGQEPGLPYLGEFPGSTDPALIVPLNFSNTLEGKSYGAELALQWKAINWLSLTTTYTYFNIDIDLNGGTDTNSQHQIEGSAPNHQYTLQTSIDLSDRWALDTTLRYMDAVRYKSIDSYFELDLRLAWQYSEQLELSLVGQNLLKDHHTEFESNLFGPNRIEIERAVYGMFSWKL